MLINVDKKCVHVWGSCHDVQADLHTCQSQFSFDHEGGQHVISVPREWFGPAHYLMAQSKLHMSI